MRINKLTILQSIQAGDPLSYRALTSNQYWLGSRPVDKKMVQELVREGLLSYTGDDVRGTYQLTEKGMTVVSTPSLPPSD